MITIKNLRELIEKLPDNASVTAYEGEDTGLQIFCDDKDGWIETGWSSDEECNPKKHDLDEFRQEKS